MNNLNETEALRRDVDAMVSHARSRARMTGTVMFLLVLALGGYYYWAYGKISNEFKVDAVGALVEVKIQEQLPGAREQLAQRLKELAPDVMKHGQEAAMSAPAKLKEWMIANSIPRIQEELDKLVAELLPVMEQELEDLASEFKDVPEAERGEKIMERLAEDFRKEVIAAIDRSYGNIQGQLDERVNYLQTLAKNEGLDEREQKHRELLQATVALFEKWEQLNPTNTEIKVKDVLENVPEGLPKLDEGTEG